MSLSVSSRPGFPQAVVFVAAIAVALLLSFGSTAHSQTATTSVPNRITVEARMTPDGGILQKGVEWRIFDVNQGLDGKLEMLASAIGGTKSFEITPGDYVVHAAYGHAGAIRRINVGGGPKRETFVLNAGGLRLDAISGDDTPIPTKYLAFDVYGNEVDERGNRKLIAKGLKKNAIVPFPVGTYHVVSRFGTLNAEVRADLRVQPGVVTDAKLKHRASLVSLRLVSNQGGEALADTQWSVLTDSGDVIKESGAINPVMVLSEGNYTAIARHKSTTFSKNFRITAGRNIQLEVLTSN